MEYKILINGGNSALLRDFFMNTTGFNCMSTSGFWADLSAHYEMFKPDVYVCIAEYSDVQVMSQIRRIKKHETFGNVPVVLIAGEDCFDFYYDENEDQHIIDLLLSRPIKIASICEQITKMLHDIEQEKLRAAKEEEEMERRVMAKLAAAQAAQAAQEKTAQAAQNIQSEPTNAQGSSQAKYGQAVQANAGAAVNTAEGKKHILVVDDDKNILKLLKVALEDRFEVTAISGGRMALRFLETRTPDLIFLDYEMPIENGSVVFRKIKNNERIKHIPVVFLTGIADREKITEVLSLKPQGYLLKPINMDRVNETIKAILG